MALGRFQRRFQFLEIPGEEKFLRLALQSVAAGRAIGGEIGGRHRIEILERILCAGTIV